MRYWVFLARKKRKSPAKHNLAGLFSTRCPVAARHEPYLMPRLRHTLGAADKLEWAANTTGHFLVTLDDVA